LGAVSEEIRLGDVPEDYMTGPGTPIQNTTIDFNSAGRQWTYQYCREFGFYQTASKLHRVRSYFVNDKYFRDQCAEIFPGLNYNTTTTYPTI